MSISIMNTLLPECDHEINHRFYLLERENTIVIYKFENMSNNIFFIDSAPSYINHNRYGPIANFNKLWQDAHQHISSENNMPEIYEAFRQSDSENWLITILDITEIHSHLHIFAQQIVGEKTLPKYEAEAYRCSPVENRESQLFPLNIDIKYYSYAKNSRLTCRDLVEFHLKDIDEISANLSSENKNTAVVYCLTNKLTTKMYIGWASSYKCVDDTISVYGAKARFKRHWNNAHNNSDDIFHYTLYEALRSSNFEDWKINVLYIGNFEEVSKIKGLFAYYLGTQCYTRGYNDLSESAYESDDEYLDNFQSWNEEEGELGSVSELSDISDCEENNDDSTDVFNDESKN